MRTKFQTELVRVCFVLMLLPCLAGAQNNPAPSPDTCPSAENEHALASSVLHPFWKTSRMDRETALFELQPGTALATAKLLFAATSILQVTSANGEVAFKPGQDYLWTPGTNLLTLTPNSRIPFKTWAQLHPPIGAPNTLLQAVGGKSSVIFFHSGAVFQSFQVAITYEHKQKWTGYVPQPAPEALTRAAARLRAKESLKLVVIGDSISNGAGASETFHKMPCQPPLAGLVVDGLSVKYKAPITLSNLSVGGTTSEWGATMASKVASEHPDLVILAFGMNDASGRIPAATYSRNIQKIMAVVRESSPNVDFILVATMSGNPEWSGSDPALYTEYRDALSRLVGPAVALADMTSLSRDILKSKKFDDVTANGVNHPNDFGHRLYAQVILQLFR